MASRGERVYHQDYIARIRYSNNLPPPPNPPKLLAIPGTGVSSHYTSAAYASRLVREQPLNIEADAELGMPIDLVGLPGVFEGDDSCLYGHEAPPNPHPSDRPLLKSLGALGKSVSSAQGVSFLRRTEFVSSEQARGRQEAAARVKAGPTKRKRDEEFDEHSTNPQKILRGILKSFNIAHPQDAAKTAEIEPAAKDILITREETEAWRNPTHPASSELKVVDSYPLMTDLEGLPDTVNYMVVKFSTNPLPATDVYDERLDHGIFRPLDMQPAVKTAYDAALAAHQADPEANPAPNEDFDYELLLPEANSLDKLPEALDVRNPSRDDEALYPNKNPETGAKTFVYRRLRTYETHHQVFSANEFGDFVALALDDGNGAHGKKQKAAYMYPIARRVNLRPRRAAQSSSARGAPVVADDAEDKVDAMELSIRDLEGDEGVMLDQKVTAWREGTAAGG